MCVWVCSLVGKGCFNVEERERERERAVNRGLDQGSKCVCRPSNDSGPGARSLSRRLDLVPILVTTSENGRKMAMQANATQPPSPVSSRPLSPILSGFRFSQNLLLVTSREREGEGERDNQMYEIYPLETHPNFTSRHRTSSLISRGDTNYQVMCSLSTLYTTSYMFLMWKSGNGFCSFFLLT